MHTQIIRKAFASISYISICTSKDLTLIVHVHNILVFSKDKVWTNIFIKFLSEGDKNFKLTNKRNIDKYLDVKIKRIRMNCTN